MRYPTVQRAGDHLEGGERKWRDVVGRGCGRMGLPDHVQGQVACSTLSFRRGKKGGEEEEGKCEGIAEGAGHCYGVCLPTRHAFAVRGLHSELGGEPPEYRPHSHLQGHQLSACAHSSRGEDAHLKQCANGEDSKLRHTSLPDGDRHLKANYRCKKCTMAQSRRTASFCRGPPWS